MVVHSHALSIAVLYISFIMHVDGQMELLPPQICIGDVVCNPSYDATGYNDQPQEPPNANLYNEIGLSPELFRLEFTLSSEGIAK